MTVLKKHFLIITIVLQEILIHLADGKWVHSNVVDKLIDSSMKCYDLNGLGISIVENDRIIYEQAYGYSDSKNEIKYNEVKTKILLASISKSFAAVMINYYSILNRFDMRASINSLAMVKDKVEFESKIRTEMTSFEDLLAHKMAIYRHDFNFLFDGMPFDKLLKLLKYIPTLPDKYFRVKFIYNNIMYVVAEKVLEKMLNRSYTDLMNESIFSTLNLTNTTFMTKSADISQMVKSSVLTENISDKILRTSGNILAAAGVITTLEDIGKWQLFLTNGRYSKNLKMLNDALKQTIVPRMTLNGDMGNLQLKINETLRKKLNIKKFIHSNYGMGWFWSNYRDYEVSWHGGSYLGVESNLVWIPELNISVFINVNARINFQYNKYMLIVQQMPLILIDLLMDNYTQISPDDVCNLFELPKSNSTANETLEIPYNFDQDIFPIINGKFKHPAFGEINIRYHENNDRQWILNPFENSTMVFEYGKLLKAILIRTNPPCKPGSFFGLDKDQNKSNNFNYYGFYLSKGQPYWFLPPIIIPIRNANLTINSDICHVLIQHNMISNELKLQTRFVDTVVVEFVRKNMENKLILAHSVVFAIMSSNFLGQFLV